MHLSLAPLQTYTDYHFRNAFQLVFGGVDQFYAPYLKLNNDGEIKPATRIDVLAVNNPLSGVTPQIMACGTADFLLMARYLEDLGYEEINWNLGCPYPMVTNKNLGAGILDKPDELRRNLDTLLPQLKSKLGIKMRMGMESTGDILALLPMLNDYPVTEIIIHARYAKQLYNGGCDHDRFEECIDLSRHPLCYNGDITDLETFQELQSRFPTINRWMIGRGAMANPGIFEAFKTGEPLETESYYQRLLVFNECLTESLESANKDRTYPLTKLKSYWEYLAEGLEEGNRLYRKLKKSKDLSAFREELSYFLES